MIAINVPKESRFVSDRIKNLYEDVSYQALCSVVTFFLLNKPSISQLVRDCPFTMSCSSLGRAVKKFPPNRLMRRARASFKRKFKLCLGDKDRFVFVIDDTDNPRFGKGFTGVGKWGCSKGVYSGQKIVCLIAVDVKNKKSYPLGYRISTKSKVKNSLDLAVDLVKEALQSDLPKLPVVTDSWFSSVRLMEDLQKLGCEYIGEIKSNRRVKTSPNPNSDWTTLEQAFIEVERERVKTHWDQKKIRARVRRRKTLATRVMMIKNRKSPVKIAAMYNRRNACSAFAYYISTERTSSGARIWLMSRVRWAIECVFRSCKQNLAFGNLSCTGESASHLAVEMPLYLYLLIQLEPEKFGAKLEDSVDLTLARLRERELASSIDMILGGQKTEGLNKLRNRHSIHRASRKPCDKAAA